MLLGLAVLATVGCGSTPEVKGTRSNLLEVPFIKQEEWYCGAVAIAQTSRYYGRFHTQYAVASEIFSRKNSGFLNLDIALYLRQRGFWTKTLVLKGYGSNKEKEAQIKELTGVLKEFVDRGHPVIVLLGPKPRDMLGLNVRLFAPPLFYISDYDEITGLNHYVVVTGYDDREGVFFFHDGHKPNAQAFYKDFVKRWKTVDCWALVAVPPDQINWEVTRDEALNAGVMLENWHNYEKALFFYKNALQRTEKNDKQKRTQILFNMANAHSARREFGKAEEILTGLKDMPGYQGPVLNNLAEIRLKQKGDLKGAEQMIREAILSDQQNALYYLDTYAMILLNRGQALKARTAMEKALKDELPDEVNAVLHFHMGQILLALNEHRPAFQYFGQAVDFVDEDRDPERESEYTLAWSRVGLQLGELEKARSGLQKVVALDSGEMGWQAKEELLKLRSR
ncbi:C39 family peptidase [Planctomycetota bacterium]